MSETNNERKEFSKTNKRRNSNYRGKNRNNKNYKRSDGVPNKDREDVTTDKLNKEMKSYVGSTNDISWYNRNAQIIHDAAKIPFSNQLGRTLDMRSTTGSDPDYSSATLKDFTVPGVMELCMINTPGLATDASDGVNIATALTFQKMRKELSTYATYAAADVMMYIMGLDSIFSQYSNLARLFGIVNAYSSINLYTPDSLIMAGYGFTKNEVNTFKASINNFRARFNNLIYKASTLFLPVDFSIIARHAWLYSNYFVDNLSRKAQYYIHHMMGYYEIDETTDPNGTMCKYRTTSTSINGLLNDFDTCIEKYRNSDSMLKIAADMRRAFQDSSQWKMAYVDENYIVLPSIDKTVLTQIHNLTILPYTMYYEFITANSGYNKGRLNIVQDVNHNIVKFEPRFQIDHTDYPTWYDEFKMANPLVQNVILDYNDPEVSEDMIVEGTRNVLTYIATHNAQIDALVPLSVSADMCVGINIWYKDPSNVQGFSRDVITSSYVQFDETDATEFPEVLRVMRNLSLFNWAPKIWFHADKYDPTFICQLDNYTVVDVETIARLNNNIMCSMWSVPQLGE